MADDRQKVIQSAEKLVSRGRIQAAIDQYRKVLEHHPNDTTTLNRVGDLYVRLNRMPKAIDLFQQTAESFGRQGFFVKAIAIYKKIIRLEPGQIRAYEALAELYHRQGLTGDSLAQYQVVADYYMKHEEVEAAIDVYYSMISIEPNNPTRRLQLAGILHEHGQSSRALDQYYEIASLMLEHSRGEDAARVLAGALDVDAEDLDFVRKAATTLQEAGFDRLVEGFLDAAVDKNPSANAVRLDLVEPQSAIPMPVEEPPEEPAESPRAAAEGEPPTEEPIAEMEPTAETPVPEVVAGDVEEAPVVEEASVHEEPAEIAEFDPAELVLATTESEEAGSPAAAEEETSSIVVEEDPEPLVAADEEADIVLELDATTSGEAEFMLEDVAVEEREVPAGTLSEEPEAVVDEAPAAEEALGFELDVDEISAQLMEAEGVAEDLAAEPQIEPEPPATAEPSVAAQATDFETSGESIKLLIEAEVLARYGMDEMAIAVLDRVLTSEPEQMEAMARLVRLQLRTGHLLEALTQANRLAEIVASEGAPQAWGRVCEAMERHGFDLVDGRFVGEIEGEPTVEPEEAEVEVDAVVEPELTEPEPFVEPEAPVSEVEPTVEPEAPVSEVETTIEPEVPVSEVEPVVEPEPAMSEAASPELVEVEEVPEPESVVEREPALEEVLEESSVSAETVGATAESTEDILAEVIEEIERADRDRSVAEEAPAAEEAPPPADAEAIAATEKVAEPAPAPTPGVEADVELEADSEIEVEPELETPAAAEVALEEVPELIDEELHLELPEAEAEAEVEADVEAATPGDWLDEVTSDEALETDAEVPQEDFVDLATELEAELLGEGDLEDELLPATGEQSLEEIVEGFRQGMAETLSDEDYDTHYNLGIAYREMGLIDEAIGEFQMAAKDPRYLVECCSLLATCFVDKSFYDLAVQWYERGLESPVIVEEERLGLLYELGTLLVATGEPEAARQRFLEVYGINSNYRDIVAKLAELNR